MDTLEDVAIQFFDFAYDYVLLKFKKDESIIHRVPNVILSLISSADSQGKKVVTTGHVAEFLISLQNYVKENMLRDVNEKVPYNEEQQKVSDNFRWLYELYKADKSQNG